VIVERLARPAAEPTPSSQPLTAALRQAWTVFWWLLRVHLADVHGLPRGQAGAAPCAWLRGWPRGHD
jgi:hypothetical protein